MLSKLVLTWCSVVAIVSITLSFFLFHITTDVIGDAKEVSATALLSGRSGGSGVGGSSVDGCSGGGMANWG